MDARTASITAQVAAKIAADLSSTPAEYAACIEGIHQDLVDRSEKGLTEQPAADPFAAAQANVATVFGAPAANPFPPVAAPTPFVQPAATGGDKNAAKWADLIANRDNWWDNRAQGGTSITGGGKPDFRHKTAKDEQDRPVGLWLVDNKYGKHAPDAVFQALGLTAPGAAPVATAPGLPDPF
jgi:hypothetical protein